MADELIKAIQVPVRTEQPATNCIEVRDANDQIVCEITQVDEDDLTLIDWDRADIIVAALNAYLES